MNTIVLALALTLGVADLSAADKKVQLKGLPAAVKTAIKAGTIYVNMKT